MNITESGTTFIKEVFTQNHADCLRVVFAGQGCCGPKFGLSLEEPQDDDIVQIIDDIKVAIENRVVSYTQDLTLDYQVNESGSGLVMVGGSSC